jgi:FkbM family methyltransferase
MKSLLKRIARRAGLVVVASHNHGVRYLDRPTRTPFDDALLRVFPVLDGLNFIQIGANDGVRGDPIHPYIRPYGWSGLMVEPVPAIFAQLRQNHSSNALLTFLNAAVAEQAGERPIYTICPTLVHLPDWVHGLGSLDENRVRATAAKLHLAPDAIVSEPVRSVTWQEVLTQFGPRRCDILIVDTEGYDITVLKLARLELLKPVLIQFEHANIDRATVISFYADLIGLGYEIATAGPDTVAWLPRMPP